MAVTKEQLPEFIRKTLGPEYLTKAGGIIYSSHETICAGDVYLIGLNPGGTGGSETLDKCLDRNMKQTNNAYWPENDEERWSASQLQPNVRWLLGELVGEEKAKKVFATNLVFMQSREVATFKVDVGIDIHVAADACWPVHEAFLNIVRPRLILAFGNDEVFSTYSYIRAQCNGKDKEFPPKPSGFRDWKLKGFKTTIAEQEDVFVAGLPHLSYPVVNDETINWIRAACPWLKK